MIEKNRYTPLVMTAFASN